MLQIKTKMAAMVQALNVVDQHKCSAILPNVVKENFGITSKPRKLE